MSSNIANTSIMYQKQIVCYKLINYESRRYELFSRSFLLSSLRPQNIYTSGQYGNWDLMKAFIKILRCSKY